MQLFKAALIVCATGCATALLFRPYAPISLHQELHQATTSQKSGTLRSQSQSQSPLRGTKGIKLRFNTSGQPAYKHGQHTLVPQDDALCQSYGERQWTGSIDVTNTHRLFFWAFESRNDPANDPVIFWMNGGPGASSLPGAFGEMGACVLRNGSTIPELNDWAWNNNATVIFLDQPAGVGFSSVAPGGTPSSRDDQGAEDFQEFLNIFFKDLFPDKAHLPIHIAAESYGGHYGPTAVIDFGGLMMGMYHLLCKDNRSKGILSQEQCEDMLVAMPEGERLWRQCGQSLSGPVCDVMAVYMNKKLAFHYNKLIAKGERSPYHIHRPCPDRFCSNIERGNFTEYLNGKAVKKALGFPESFEYREINTEIDAAYEASLSAWIPTTSLVGSVLDAYKTPKIVDDGNSIGDVRVLVLSGNLDMAANSHGNKLQYERVIWSRMGEYRAAPWQDVCEEEVAATGSWKATSDGRLAFIAVDNAGHMLPGDVPEASYRILLRWMRNGWQG